MTHEVLWFLAGSACSPFRCTRTWTDSPQRKTQLRKHCPHISTRSVPR